MTDPDFIPVESMACYEYARSLGGTLEERTAILNDEVENLGHNYAKMKRRLRDMGVEVSGAVTCQELAQMLVRQREINLRTKGEV